jgi:hypothetical protein
MLAFWYGALSRPVTGLARASFAIEHSLACLAPPPLDLALADPPIEPPAAPPLDDDAVAHPERGVATSARAISGTSLRTGTSGWVRDVCSNKSVLAVRTV